MPAPSPACPRWRPGGEDVGPDGQVSGALHAPALEERDGNELPQVRLVRQDLGTPRGLPGSCRGSSPKAGAARRSPL
jgi:hypothetical protein